MSIAGLEPFVYTAELSSFSQAAGRLGVSPAAVSKAIKKLEQDLGVRLFNRTSRHVSLTPEGEVYYAHASEALARLKTGRDLVTRAREEAQGTLRVSLPFVITTRVLSQLHRLAATVPKVDFELLASDRFTSLLAEGFDVALRIGELDDSSMVARRLGAMRWVTCASPSYLTRHGAPRHPDDLAGHECLQFVLPGGAPGRWMFRDGANEPRGWDVPSRFRMNLGTALIDGAVAGLGICHVFDHLVIEHLRDGRLVPILTDYAPPGPSLHALCAEGRQNTPRIRAFIDFCVGVFA